MKSLVAALFVASSAFVPSLSFAQQTPPKQAQMPCAMQQGQMQQSQTSGQPSGTMHGTGCDTSGSGPSMNGSAQEGAPMWHAPNQSLFKHH